MLEFWFAPQTSLTKKLSILIIIAIITAILYKIQPLSVDAILMFLGTGLIFLICRYCKTHFTANTPTRLLYRVLTWIPIAILLALIFKNMQNGEILIPGAQGIGFMAVAVCVFSPLSLLHRNKSE